MSEQQQQAPAPQASGDEFSNLSKVVQDGPADIGLLEEILEQPILESPGIYTTAMRVDRKRDVNDVLRRLLEEANLAGEDFYYGWGVGKDAIEGPSQELAHALARCWGNCVVEPLPMSETPDAWVFTARFVDLETGFTIARQFRQSKKWTVHGKMDAERKDDIRFQIGQSKAARNVVLKALPSWIVTQALTKAKEGVRKKIESLIASRGLVFAIDAACAALAKAGVTEDRLLAKLGVAARGGLNVDHLVTLKGDLAAILAGRERAETIFPAPVVEMPLRKSDSKPDAK